MLRATSSEIKKLLTEMTGSDGPQFRQKCKRVLVPTFGVLGATTCGLYYHKHSSLEDVDEITTLKPNFERHAMINLPENERAKIIEAANRGCPVEQDCVSAVRGDSSVPSSMQELQKMWKEAGYFHDPALDIDEMGEILEDPTCTTKYGKDLNCQTAVQHAFNDDFITWDADSITKGLDILDNQGLLVLPNIVNMERIRDVRKILSIAQRTEDNYEARNYYGPSSENAELVKPSPGRRHFLVRNTEYEQELAPLLETVCPLIQAYLSKHRSTKKPYLSELQIGVTDPLTIKQFWHRDNVTPGLTVVVPLTPVPASIGLTGFLPYSHKNNINAVVGEVSKTLDLGDVLMYDGRIIHRGKQNLTYNKTRVVAIFRYDFEAPPGQGVFLTSVNAFLGNIINGLGWIHSVLP